ncbi:Uracil-DNA glycosylase [Spironucleus salmonicida]|uniref:Uracil-DNA glycosylase n=1 Tax=Spironucleus salmonicida TaxID=348837 RepID=V6LRS8_9EUKA|nr:Uracil-DNA glycosylase [Spironucleus salmonicida]|eukprot:EST46396.1 Uracil-DNA glycosylase [Spironucleus salmonicida]
MESFQSVIDTLNQQSNKEHYCSNADFIPRPGLIFEAFKLVKSPKQVRIVILGQDPYPRKQSAAGISFLDLQSSTLADKKQSISMRNIIKAILQHNRLFFNTMNDVRDLIESQFAIKQTKSYFTALAEDCGILFLNASLTHEDKASVNKHIKFWEPVIAEAFKSICMESPGVVFLLMGEFAKSYEKYIILGENVRVVKSCHPMMFRFLEENTFEQIKEAEQSLNQGVTDFIKCKIIK